MKSHMRNRARARSLSAVPPPQASEDYSQEMAKVAASVLYKSPIPTKSGHSVYILNAAALPDTREIDYDTLLPYLLSRLPGEDNLVSGTEYEVIFFAGSGAESATALKKSRPGWGWFFQAYHLLSRAMRKRIKKLYIVHERTWVRILTEMFSTVVSPKFRRKMVHGMSLV
jgi:Rho GTPase-activating protein 1